MKSRLGYTMRDFLYYKKWSGNNVATLCEIQTEMDASGMITMNDEEREVRLILSTDRIIERNVSITPMKLPLGTAFYEEEFTNEPLDDYKDWLAELHTNNRGRGTLSCCTSVHNCILINSLVAKFNNISMFPELCDMFREDTVKAYNQRLRLEGQLDDIGNIISLSKL